MNACSQGVGSRLYINLNFMRGTHHFQIPDQSRDKFLARLKLVALSFLFINYEHQLSS